MRQIFLSFSSIVIAFLQPLGFLVRAKNGVSNGVCWIDSSLIEIFAEDLIASSYDAATRNHFSLYGLVCPLCYNALLAIFQEFRHLIPAGKKS